MLHTSSSILGHRAHGTVNVSRDLNTIQNALNTTFVYRRLLQTIREDESCQRHIKFVPIFRPHSLAGFLCSRNKRTSPSTRGKNTSLRNRFIHSIPLRPTAKVHLLIEQPSGRTVHHVGTLASGFVVDMNFVPMNFEPHSSTFHAQAECMARLPPTREMIGLKIPYGAWEPDTLITDTFGNPIFSVLDVQHQAMGSYEAIFGDENGHKLCYIKRRLITKYWLDGWDFCTYKPNFPGQPKYKERDMYGSKSSSQIDRRCNAIHFFH